MGLNLGYITFMEAAIAAVFGEGVRGLKMLELGDQVFRDGYFPEPTGKEYFQNRGYEHVSVDLNGKHGAVVRNLTKPSQFQDWIGKWDIITNAGTTEHVEPFEAQYECFSIINDCLKVGGLALHIIPDVHELDRSGKWKNHCHFYYSEAFFAMLVRECGYEMVANRLINGNRCVALKRTKPTLLPKDRTVFLREISRR